MGKPLVFAAALCVASCSHPIEVPTEAQFEQNPDLLMTWLKKCRHGEYSNFGQDAKSRMCGSAEAASNAITQRQAAKDADATFGGAILRK